MSAGFTQSVSLGDGFKAMGLEEGAKDWDGLSKNAIAAGVVGGTASVIGGGKFANGAMTGAMSRLLNDCAHGCLEAKKGAKVIDSTSEALDHYFDGSGEDVELGPNTKDALRNHPLVKRQSEALRSGTAKHLNDNLSVEMRGEIYHVGKTRVDFSTDCQSGSCTTTYVGFSNDGFWDPIAPVWFGDGIGGNWEIYGGTGYHYNTYTWSETYTDKF